MNESLNSIKMKKQSTQRKYNIPDADLYLLCVEKLKMLNRDRKEFIKYGYGASKLKGFANQVEKFRQLPDDDEMVGDQMVVTEKKTMAAEKLKTAIRSIMTRVSMKFGNRSGRYRKFGTAKMGDMSDAQLLFCGRRVIRVARKEIDFLADVGLNETAIGKVVNACKTFENALNIQQDKIADRDIGVENRTIQGNKIYDELIILCDIGKDIWADNDTVKYEGYVLYESNNEQKKKRKQKIAEK